MPNLKWEHPDLGKFKRSSNGDCAEWTGTLTLPAFAKFRYGFGGPFRGSKKVRLKFRSNENGYMPNLLHVSLAKKIVRNQGKLADKIKKVFFDDLTGRRPDSGMWWHNDSEAREFCADVLEQRLKRRELKDFTDLELLLCGPNIEIFDDGEKFARIDFVSPFEYDHGVEVITDGTKILGLGYQGGAEPFRPNGG